MAFDSEKNYYNETDNPARHLPPEFQTCGNCIRFRRYTGFRIGMCIATPELTLVNQFGACRVTNADGEPAFVPLADLTIGWVHTSRKRSPLGQYP